MPYFGNKKRKYDRDRTSRRRQEWLFGKKCIVCGTQEKLEIHHKNPKEKITHNVWSWNKEKMLKELSKCEIRCRCHHKEAHGKGPAKHGTDSKYRTGCRCLDCKKAHAFSEKKRQWKKKGIIL
jgi:hypothetical protein